MASSSKEASPPVQRKRLALGPNRRRIRYEQRVRLRLLLLALPSVVLAAWIGYLQSGSLPVALSTALGAAAVFGIACVSFFETLIHPLQTLTNVVAALRDDDFSLRARGASRGDALGDLAFEINALAGTLQTQRSSARDALTLVERVMTSMQAPVLAFDGADRLLMLNEAAAYSFSVHPKSLGRLAGELGLETLLATRDEDLYVPPAGGGQAGSLPVRWSVRRTTFRLHGVPHTLLVLADVAGALREEERTAWQRLIRVLSHEINNSITPIMSIAGSLRDRIPVSIPVAPNDGEDLRRGLTVIEERAASLTRFLQAYQRLTRLPSPHLKTVPLHRLVQQTAHLEHRLAVEVQGGSPVMLEADPDQIQQLLINLVRNAVEAALHTVSDEGPRVGMRWSATGAFAIVQVRDNGLGLIDPANLFVPFYTTKPEGSGIGLVLAQQIASAHKGTVTLYNNLDGSGCTAELRIPLIQTSKE